MLSSLKGTRVFALGKGQWFKGRVKEMEFSLKVNKDRTREYHYS